MGVALLMTNQPGISHLSHESRFRMRTRRPETIEEKPRTPTRSENWIRRILFEIQISKLLVAYRIVVDELKIDVMEDIAR